MVELVVSHLYGDDKVGLLPVLNNKETHVSGWSLRSCFGMQAHLALCCKALLPILCMGHVAINVDKHGSARHLLNATRCLRKQPSGASHPEIFSRDARNFGGTLCFGTRRLIDLRCAHASIWCWCVHGRLPCCAMAMKHAGWDWS